jgi:hypothetical protein
LKARICGLFLLLSGKGIGVSSRHRVWRWKWLGWFAALDLCRLDTARGVHGTMRCVEVFCWCRCSGFRREETGYGWFACLDVSSRHAIAYRLPGKMKPHTQLERAAKLAGARFLDVCRVDTAQRVMRFLLVRRGAETEAEFSRPGDVVSTRHAV